MQYLFENMDQVQHTILEAPQHCYHIQQLPPHSPPHHRIKGVSILADEDLGGIILSLQWVIYSVGGEEGRAGDPGPHFYSIPIGLDRGYNFIWWEENESFQHYSQTNEWGSYPFLISFPGMQNSHFIISDQGLYLPHHMQVPHVYTPGELNPPTLTRVHRQTTPPSLFHSSLIAAGLLIKAHPPLDSGLIGIKRAPNFIYLNLANAKHRIPILLSRP